MEHLLELYQKPYDPKRPMVCFDEKSFQLLAHLTKMLTLKSGHAARQDYTCTWRKCRCEYKRNGTRNLFLFVEPKAGARHVLVTHRRTKFETVKVLIEASYTFFRLYNQTPDKVLSIIGAYSS